MGNARPWPFSRSDGEDAASEDLDAALRKLQAFTTKAGDGGSRGTLALCCSPHAAPQQPYSALDILFHHMVCILPTAGSATSERT